MGESEIAHLICDLCFDPQTILCVLKFTVPLGGCCAVGVQMHIWHTLTRMHI